jgi:hypothetical protein
MLRVVFVNPALVFIASSLRRTLMRLLLEEQNKHKHSAHWQKYPKGNKGCNGSRYLFKFITTA